MKADFIYSAEVDSLSVFTNRKSAYTIEVGEDLILGMDREKRVAGIEILDPDRKFKIRKRDLLNISSASIDSRVQGGVLWINLHLNIEGVEREMSIPLVRTS